MDLLLNALSVALALDSLTAIVIGTFIGVVFGSIPGLTFTVALALVLPVTFSLAAAPAIGLLLGTYIGGMTGGSVSAILLGIPGTPSSAATVIDGYQLTRQGKASLALGTAVIVSAFGGLVSLVVMICMVDVVARLALRFGPAEIFALVLFGLSTICGLSEKSLVRGLIAGVIGLMVMTIGIDNIDGVLRLTFGTVILQQGINLLVAMIALFAVPHIIDAFVLYYRGEGNIKQTADVRVELPTLRQLGANFWLMVRCSLLGTGIGAIPGTGGPIAAFLAYTHAKRTSKNPEQFGKGAIAGVVAPETANNAVTGGAMIPLLSLGIPGDPATAIVLSGLLIHGLVPGPMLFIQQPGAIYEIYIAIIVAYSVSGPDPVAWHSLVRAIAARAGPPPRGRHHRHVRVWCLCNPQLGIRRLHDGRARGCCLRAHAGQDTTDADYSRAGSRANAGTRVPDGTDPVGRQF